MLHLLCLLFIFASLFYSLFFVPCEHVFFLCCISWFVLFFAPLPLLIFSSCSFSRFCLFVCSSVIAVAFHLYESDFSHVIFTFPLSFCSISSSRLFFFLYKSFPLLLFIFFFKSCSPPAPLPPPVLSPPAPNHSFALR